LQLNGGTLQLTGGLNYARNTTVGGSMTIPKRKHGAGGGSTDTLGTLSLGAFTLTTTRARSSNSTGASVAFGAGTLTAAGTINTNNSFFNSAPR